MNKNEEQSHPTVHQGKEDATLVDVEDPDVLKEENTKPFEENHSPLEKKKLTFMGREDQDPWEREDSISMQKETVSSSGTEIASSSEAMCSVMKEDECAVLDRTISAGFEEGKCTLQKVGHTSWGSGDMGRHLMHSEQRGSSLSEGGDHYLLKQENSGIVDKFNLNFAHKEHQFSRETDNFTPIEKNDTTYSSGYHPGISQKQPVCKVNQNQICKSHKDSFEYVPHVDNVCGPFDYDAIKRTLEKGSISLTKKAQNSKSASERLLNTSETFTDGKDSGKPVRGISEGLCGDGRVHVEDNQPQKSENCSVHGHVSQVTDGVEQNDKADIKSGSEEENRDCSRNVGMPTLDEHHTLLKSQEEEDQLCQDSSGIGASQSLLHEDDEDYDQRRGSSFDLQRGQSNKRKLPSEVCEREGDVTKIKVKQEILDVEDEAEQGDSEDEDDDDEISSSEDEQREKKEEDEGGQEGEEGEEESEMMEAEMLEMVLDPNDLEYVPESSDDSGDEDPEVAKQKMQLTGMAKVNAEEIVEKEKKVEIICEICKKKFTSKFDYSKHMSEEHHYGDKEQKMAFQCEICGKGFHFQSSLNSHRSKAHHQTADDGFQCPYCPAVAATKHSMRRHLRNTHGTVSFLSKELSYKCSFCDQLFWDMGARNQHQVEEHPDRLKEYFKCYLCSQISPHKLSIKRHMQRSHPEAPLLEEFAYKCKHCLMLFPKAQPLREHMKEQHPVTTEYLCNQCNMVFKNGTTLKRHIKVIHSELREKQKQEKQKVLVCQICGKNCKNKRSLLQHSKLKHEQPLKPRLKCRICMQKFETAEERKVHYKIDHKGQFPYICQECGKGFATKSGMACHRQLHTGMGFRKCEYCGKEFIRKDSYNEHLLIHIGPRHQCSHCLKEFVQRSNLVRHIRIHTGEKPYKCTYCERRFSDKGACNSHIRVHTGEERGVCTFCGQTFSKKQKLKYHMRIHTGEGLVKCDECNKLFTSGYALRNHRKIHDRTNEFQCQQCDRSFPVAKYLQRHFENVHKEQKPFSCTKCGKSFVRQSLLQRHMWAHSGLKTMKCLLCNEAYGSRKGIKVHLINTHNIKNGTAEFKNSFVDLCATRTDVLLPPEVMEVTFTENPGTSEATSETVTPEKSVDTILGPAVSLSKSPGKQHKKSPGKKCSKKYMDTVLKKLGQEVDRDYKQYLSKTVSDNEELIINPRQNYRAAKNRVSYEDPVDDDSDSEDINTNTSDGEEMGRNQDLLNIPAQEGEDGGANAGRCIQGSSLLYPEVQVKVEPPDPDTNYTFEYCSVKQEAVDYLEENEFVPLSPSKIKQEPPENVEMTY